MIYISAAEFYRGEAILMKKIQNFFSYAKVSELPTNQIFELFDLSNNGKDVSPYKIDYAVNKDILDECQLGAYESLIELNNEVALLYDNGKIVALAVRLVVLFFFKRNIVLNEISLVLFIAVFVVAVIVMLAKWWKWRTK